MLSNRLGKFFESGLVECPSWLLFLGRQALNGTLEDGAVRHLGGDFCARQQGIEATSES